MNIYYFASTNQFLQKQEWMQKEAMHLRRIACEQ